MNTFGANCSQTCHCVGTPAGCDSVCYLNFRISILETLWSIVFKHFYFRSVELAILFDAITSGMATVARVESTSSPILQRFPLVMDPIVHSLSRIPNSIPRSISDLMAYLLNIPFSISGSELVSIPRSHSVMRVPARAVFCGLWAHLFWPTFQRTPLHPSTTSLLCRYSSFQSKEESHTLLMV